MFLLLVCDYFRIFVTAYYKPILLTKNNTMDNLENQELASVGQESSLPIGVKSSVYDITSEDIDAAYEITDDNI